MGSGHIGIILIIISVPLIIIPAFAQMESMRIEGNHYPLVNTRFSVEIIVEGTSRASYGFFGITVTIIEKETGKEIDGIGGRIYSGTNPFSFDMRSYEEGTYKAGETYVFKVQHLNQITEFEFTPVESLEDIPDNALTEKSEEVTQFAKPF